MSPPVGLCPGLVVAVDRRGAVGLGQRGGLRLVDAEVDAALVQRGDLIGGDETLAMADAQHDAVEDVLVGAATTWWTVPTSSPPEAYTGTSLSSTW